MTANDTRRVDIERLMEVVSAHVREHLTPRRMQRAKVDLVELHAASLQVLSDRFTSERPERAADYMAKPPMRAAYLLYYVPTGAATAAAVLRLGGLLPSLRSATEPLRVLDLGAGPLTATIGLALSAPGRRLDVTAVDGVGKSLKDGVAILRALAPAVRIRTRVANLHDRRLWQGLAKERFDLVLVGNVLNEWRDTDRRRRSNEPSSVLFARRALQLLNTDGRLVLFEPASRVASSRLIEVRRHLLDGDLASVEAPCTGHMTCPLASGGVRSWCHSEQPWQRPQLLAALDDAIGHRRNTLQFSYLVLAHRREMPFDGSRWRVIGGPMHDGHLVRRYLCGQPGRVVAVYDKQELAGRHPLVEAWRGDIVTLGGAWTHVRGKYGNERRLRVKPG